MNELDFTSATINEFEPKDEMYGSDIETEPETEPQPASQTSLNRSYRSNLASSSDEIDAFKSALQPTPPKKPRKKRTKKVVEIQDPNPKISDSDSDEKESPQKVHVSKKISADDVSAAINDDVSDKMSESDDPGPTGTQQNRENTSDSDEEMSNFPRKKKRRVILDSDSD